MILSRFPRLILLCDICRKRRAVYYREGATSEPDSITVYCWECGKGLRDVRPFSEDAKAKFPNHSRSA